MPRSSGEEVNVPGASTFLVDHTMPLINTSSSPRTMVSWRTLDLTTLFSDFTLMMIERNFTNDVLGVTVRVITFGPLPDVSLNTHQSVAELLDSASSIVHASFPVIVNSYVPPSAVTGI